MRPELPPNTCRYRRAPGHVESYFLRANDPARPRALWLKATILAPLASEALIESWFIYFDGEKGRTFSERETSKWSAGAFAERGAELAIRANRCELLLGARGHAQGEVAGRGERARFDLSWEPLGGALSESLSIMPWRILREGPFPKSKLLTPHPWLRFSGKLEVQGESISLEGWDGMQGHNWGKEHAYEYAWGQCLFPPRAAEPATMVEGFSGRVKLGGWVSPRLSALVVRRGERVYAFDRLFDFWRQEAEVGPDRWSLQLSGSGGQARLRMDASGKPIVCLDYKNPDGVVSHCYNSKLAEAVLEVRPRDGAPFECRSSHGAALELLRREGGGL